MATILPGLKVGVVASDDVQNSLARLGKTIAIPTATQDLAHGHQGELPLELLTEPASTTSQLLARLEQAAADIDTPTPSPGAVLFDPDLAAVVLSIKPDLQSTLPPERLATSSSSVEFNLIRIVEVLREHTPAHVLVLNCSTYDPEDMAHSFPGGTDTRSLQANRLDLALANASRASGLSVVDVDQVLAELGAHRHVRSFLEYSEDAYDAIGKQVERLIAELGLLHEAVAEWRDQPILFPLTVPPYDRRVSTATITQWFTSVGDHVSRGDLLFQMRADNLSWRLEQKAQGRASKRFLELAVSAATDGVVRRIDAEVGDAVQVGQVIAMLTDTHDSAVDLTRAVERASPFPVAIDVAVQ